MNKICIACEHIYKGSVDFYKDLDDPRLRFIKIDFIHSAYKVAAVSAFAFSTSIYVTYKAITQ